MIAKALVVLSLALAASGALAASSKKALTWAALTVEQQQILAPLKGDWDKMDPARRRKWLGIAKRYPKLKPASQERVQKRMREWAELTPQQRARARANYRRLHNAPPEKRREIEKKWAEYERQHQPAPPAKRPQLQPQQLQGAR